MRDPILTEYGRMAYHFNCQKLSTLCIAKSGVQTGPFGSLLHKEDYAPTGTPIITVEHLLDNRISHINTPFVSDSDTKRLSKFSLAEGDIVFSRVGSVDRRALVRREEDCWLFSGRCLRVRVDKQKIDPVYLSYFFGLEGFKSHIRSIAVGATMPSINTKILSDVKIYYPCLEEQKSIAIILGTIDDKIELNRQMNTMLEAMAQALFKSWFVDFDPVIDNALAAGTPIPEALQVRAAVRQALGEQRKPLPKTILQQFPSCFEFSEEMGWVPEGWSVSLMPEVTDYREGPGILAKDFHQEGVPLIRLAGLKNGVSLLDGCNYLDPAKVEEKWSHFRLEEGDILLSASASLGRIAEVEEQSVGAIPYTGIIGFRPIVNKTVRRYLRHYLTSVQFQTQVTMMGAGSVLNHFGPTHIKKMHMLVPSLLLQEKFSELATPIDLTFAHRLRQSQTLTVLRDTLLPKLLSGELRIPDAEKLVAIAL